MGIVNAGFACPKCRCYDQKIWYSPGSDRLVVTCLRCGYERKVLPYDHPDCQGL